MSEVVTKNDLAKIERDGRYVNSKKLFNKILDALKTGFDTIYPVGCYYWTSDEDFIPDDVFGGEWEKIDAGVTLVSAGDGYTVQTGTSADGGSPDAIVPWHNHGITDPKHTHTITTKYAKVAAAGTARNIPQNDGSGSTTGGRTNSKEATGITINYAGTQGNTVGANMPPYKCAYCWHRIG